MCKKWSGTGLYDEPVPILLNRTRAGKGVKTKKDSQILRGSLVRLSAEKAWRQVRCQLRFECGGFSSCVSRLMRNLR